MNKIKYLTLVNFWFLMLVLSSCNNEKSGDGSPVNNYGGYGRNNSYENEGDFYRQLFVVEDYDSTNAGGSISNLLPISENEIIFPSVNGEIISINDKKVKWNFQLDSDNVVASGMAADQSHNIYAIDNSGILYSISVTGKLRWKRRFISLAEKDIITFSDLLAQKNGIIASASNGIISKYSYKGEKLWQRNFGMAFTRFFPCNYKGNIALPLTHNLYGETDTLVFLESNGKILWSKAFYKTRIIKPPVIFGDRIYLSCVQAIDELKLPELYCLNIKGKVLWKKELAIQVRFISVDKDSKIYIGAYNSGNGKPVSMIASLDINGNFLWKKFIEVALVSQIMISEKIISFVGVDNKASGLYFVRKNGNIENIVSLTDAPALNLLPSVAPGNIIMFGSAEKTQVIRIDNTAMKKIIPW